MKRRLFLQWTGVAALSACAPQVSPKSEAPAKEPAPASSSGEQQTRAAPLPVIVWHDLVCPWCRIGLHNLARALDAWTGPPVELVIHPFLLNPDTPPEGTDLRAYLESRYGEGSSSPMFARVTEAGARFGLRFDFEKVRISPSTVPGHALVDAAPAEKRFPLLAALGRAYFEEGRNIGDPQVLAGIADEVGIAGAAALAAATDPQRHADVRARAQQATMRGVRGVPHFRFGQRSLQGAQAPEALRAALEELARS